MTTGGGTGMDFGEDHVAARLSVEIPEGTATGVQEITEAVNRFRIAMESAAHAEMDVNRYLQEMTEASKSAAQAQANLVQQLESYMSLSSRMGGGMGMPSMGVPTGGFTQPFGGQQAGMGMPINMPGVRPPSPSDVAYQIARMPTEAPGQYLNMQHQRGAVTAQDAVSLSADSINQLAVKIAEREKALVEQHRHTDGNAVAPPTPSGGYSGEDMGGRVQRAAGLAGQVMNEVGGGGRGMGGLAVRGLQWAANRWGRQAPSRQGPPDSADESAPAGLPKEGEPGMGSPGREGTPAPQDENAPADDDKSEDKGTGGMSSILKMLGPVAGVATSALAMFGIIQKGGEMVQGWRNIGSLRGGAAGEGMEASGRVRMLAMNPFITQDQARQVFQGAMSEGYADASGGGADNVVDFVTHNLTTMNVSVADSFKMLRGTIVGSGQGDKDSVAGAVAMLGNELDTIRTLSREGVMSQPDFRAGTMRTQQALLARGGSPAEAEQTALTAEMVGSGDQAQKGQFGRIVASQATDLGSMGMRMYGGTGGTPLQGMPQGLFPQLTGTWLQEQGGDATGRAVENELQALARQSSMTSGPEENQVNIFQRRMQMMGMDTDATSNFNLAKQMYEDVRSGKQSDELKKAEEEIAKHGIGGGQQGGGGGGSGSVQIGLTPEAAKILQVIGPNPTQLDRTETNAKKGVAGAQVNVPGSGG